MKKLNQFVTFDIDRFLADKSIQVVDIKQWEDFVRKGTILGTVVEVVILTDNTPYDQKPGEKVSNRYEKFKIKVSKRTVTVDVGDFVAPINPSATVYGDRRDQLSVRADDIVVVSET